ncbi:MAG: hypothetical protein K1X92_09615 [Bacteroidia bacterium]|nr:hypothetical protein [Bacteroidia bacterium]
MKYFLFSFFAFFFFLLFFQSSFAQRDKTYKEFDTVKIELWKRVSDVNNLKKQQYAVREADSLAQVLNREVEFVRIFYTMGDIRKMEVSYTSGERRDFLWWNKLPLLIGVMKKGMNTYDLQYYFFNGTLYETKNPQSLPSDSEEKLKKQANEIRNLGYEILKVPE